jgi:outer membrane murein-binding lipoprotein Lpp
LTLSFIPFHSIVVLRRAPGKTHLKLRKFNYLLDQKLDKLSSDLTDLKVGQARLEGKIEAIDEKLSGQIKAVDEKLSGQTKTLDTKVDQLDKRIGNSELTNRGILIGLVVIIFGGAAKLFGLVGNP